MFSWLFLLGESELELLLVGLLGGVCSGSLLLLLVSLLLLLSGGDGGEDEQQVVIGFEEGGWFGNKWVDWKNGERDVWDGKMKLASIIRLDRIETMTRNSHLQHRMVC